DSNGLPHRIAALLQALPEGRVELRIFGDPEVTDRRRPGRLLRRRGGNNRRGEGDKEHAHHFLHGSCTRRMLNAGTGWANPFKATEPTGSASATSSTRPRVFWFVRICPPLASVHSRAARFVTGPIAA